MADPHETLKPYVADQLALIKHIHQAIERQKNDDRVKDDSNAIAVVQKIDGVLENQIAALESHLESLGSSGSGFKNAVGAVTGAVAGLYDKVRTEPVSTMLRDDYTALSLAAIANTMLYTTAAGVNHKSTSDLALSHLTDISPIIVDISEVMPLVVVQELLASGEIHDASAGPEAVKATQKAWGHEVIGK